MKTNKIWGWLWIVLGILYFFVPLYATLEFSLHAQKGQLSLLAYLRVFRPAVLPDPHLFAGHGRVDHPRQPAAHRAYRLLDPPAPAAAAAGRRVHHDDAVRRAGHRAGLRVDPSLRRRLPAADQHPAGTNALLVAAYVILALPYMYRAVDTGLGAIDVRTLTEAAQSLGAGWPTILLRVIFPNLRSSPCSAVRF